MLRRLQLPLYLVLLLALVQIVWHHAYLPARVATHFDLKGQADGWMSNDGYFIGQAALLAGLCLLFDRLGWLLRRLPASLINIPHREYWLAPPRREATLRWLENAGRGLGIVVLAFCMLLFQKVFAANLYGTLQLKMLPLIIGWFVFVTCLVVLMMFRFQPPESGRPGRRRS